MGKIRTRRFEKRNEKRRKANTEQAIAYFENHIPNLPTAEKRNTRKRIRDSKRPHRTAKAMVKEYSAKMSKQPAPKAAFRSEQEKADRAALIRNAFATEFAAFWPMDYEDSNAERPGIDLSAGHEARAILSRRQHPDLLRGWGPYWDEIGELDRKLINGEIKQDTYDKQVMALAKKPLPEWIENYEPRPVPAHRPKQATAQVPTDTPVPGSAEALDISGLPEFLDRRGAPLRAAAE